MFDDLDRNGQVDADDEPLGLWYLDEAAGLDEKFLMPEEARGHRGGYRAR